MEKGFIFIMLAAAAIMLNGCSGYGGEIIDVPDGTGTVASFLISFPAGTRADNTATDSESRVNDAWVFLFDDATKTLESKTELTAGVSGYSATVRTTTGKHYVYVAVNGESIYDFDTAGFSVADAATSTAGMPMTDFLGLRIDAKNSLPAGDGNFFMTGYEEADFVAPTAGVPSPAANNLTIRVGRAVGKVHMEDAHTSNPDKVAVGNLKYKVINNPVTTYGFQQYNMETKSGSVRNPVTGDAIVGRTLFYSIGAGYADASSTASAGVYVPENVNEEATTHNATSLLIQGRVFINAGVEVRGADGTVDNGYISGSTFYRVWDKSRNKWLDRFFSAYPTLAAVKGAAGVDEAARAAISDKKLTQEIAGVREFFVAEYDGGMAYWTYMLRNDGKSAVRRNDYFWVKITTIAEIGASTDSEDPDDDGILPEKPEPVDKEDTEITAEIDILKWNGVNMDGHI